MKKLILLVFTLLVLGVMILNACASSVPDTGADEGSSLYATADTPVLITDRMTGEVYRSNNYRVWETRITFELSDGTVVRLAGGWKLVEDTDGGVR